MSSAPSLLRAPTAAKSSCRLPSKWSAYGIAPHTKNDTDEYRVLERARRAVFAYFIESGEPLMNSGDPRLARIYIALAAEARPESAWPQLALPRCDAKMGRKKDAVRELQKRRLAGLEFCRRRNLASDYPEFAAISAEPEFQKMVAAAVPCTQ